MFPYDILKDKSPIVIRYFDSIEEYKRFMMLFHELCKIIPFEMKEYKEYYLKQVSSPELHEFQIYPFFYFNQNSNLIEAILKEISPKIIFSLKRDIITKDE